MERNRLVTLTLEKPRDVQNEKKKAVKSSVRVTQWLPSDKSCSAVIIT